MSTDEEIKTGLKEKITRLADNVKKNLLAASHNISRSFVLNEHDFLSLCLLALKSLDTQQLEKTEQNDNILNNKVTGGMLLKTKTPNIDQPNRLRREIIKIIEAPTFNSETKSLLITDALQRHKKKQPLENKKQ